MEVGVLVIVIFLIPSTAPPILADFFPAKFAAAAATALDLGVPLLVGVEAVDLIIFLPTGVVTGELVVLRTLVALVLVETLEVSELFEFLEDCLDIELDDEIGGIGEVADCRGLGIEEGAVEGLNFLAAGEPDPADKIDDLGLAVEEEEVGLGILAVAEVTDATFEFEEEEGEDGIPVVRVEVEVVEILGLALAKKEAVGSVIPDLLLLAE